MPAPSQPRLQRKLVLSYCLIMLLPVALISAYTLLRTREALIARARVEQLALAEARASSVEGLLADVSSDTLLLAQEPAIRRVREGQALFVGNSARAQAERVFLNVLRRAGDHYTSLCLLDAQGWERLCADSRAGEALVRPDSQLLDQSSTPAFLNALGMVSIPGRLPVAISTLKAAQEGARPMLAYSTVLSNERGQIVGVLVLTMSLEAVIELLVEHTPATYTSLVDGDGSFLMHSEPHVPRLLQEEHPVEAELILDQESGTLMSTSAQPGTFIAFARVRSRGYGPIQWTVLYERPLATVTEAVGEAQSLIVLIALAGLVGAGMMATLITRGITRPLTALAGAAERIGAGELDAPLPPSGDDEIGALAATLSQTVRRLRETIAAAERRTREAETLRAAASALSASLDREQVLNAILQELRKVVPYDSASVQLVLDGRSQIIGGYGYLNSAAIIGRSFMLEPGATPNAEVLARRDIVIYDYVPDHFPQFREEPYRADPICAWMGVPLIHGDEVIGMITLDLHVSGAFNDNHARLATAFAAHAVVAIENARLYAAARAEIAERQRAEAAYARLAAIIEATPDFVGMADLAGTPLFLNRAGRQMIGLGVDEGLANYRITDFLTPASAPLLFDQAFPAALRDGVWSGETELRHCDSRVIPVSQVLIVHHNSAGQPEFLSTVARDISERQRAEEQLRQAQKMEALGRLAGGLAHDFNNILTVIKGECELLAEELPLDSLEGEGVQQIHNAANRAAALTGQLLAFSRRQVLQPSVLNLNDSIIHAARMLGRLICEDIALSMELDPALAQVRVDPGQIELVLMNLAVNARDAMPGGGRVTISTTNLRIEPGFPAPANLDAGDWVRLSVSDTGEGMSYETLERIFEPFFTTKARGKGTGLGLAMVLGVVQQSGGDIVCVSTPGAGTRFDIFLPAIAIASDLARPAALAAPAAVYATVLLVEDDNEVRRFTRLVLERQGCQVFEAIDGASALALLASHTEPLDLLLSDIVLPGGLNGVQLAQRIRERRPTIRILYMSGYSDTAQIGQSMRDDGAHYLQKPFSPTDLALAIQQALGPLRQV